MQFHFHLKKVAPLPQLYKPLLLLQFILLLLLQLPHHLGTHLFRSILLMALSTIFFFKFHSMLLFILVERLITMGHFFEMQYEYGTDISGFTRSVLVQRLQFITTVLFPCAKLEGRWHCSLESFQLVKRWINLIGMQLVDACWVIISYSTGYFGCNCLEARNFFGSTP